MKRWLLMLAAALLIPGAALAGGGGHIRLSRSVEKVAVGKHPIYLQALQHDVHPRADAKVTIVAHSPNGTDIITPAVLDPAYGDLNVFKGNLAVDRPGVWKVSITVTECPIFFPPYEFQVDVMPAGTKLPDPGPVEPYREGAQGHDHGTPAQGAQAAAQDTSAEATAAPAPGRLAAWTWPVTATGAAGVGLAGYLVWRRRGPKAG